MSRLDNQAVEIFDTYISQIVFSGQCSVLGVETIDGSEWGYVLMGLSLERIDVMKTNNEKWEGLTDSSQDEDDDKAYCQYCGQRYWSFANCPDCGY